MLRRTLLAGLLLAPMILTACDDKDASGPQGTNGVVTVTAYVDANGSGTPDAGDAFLTGRSITLASGDGETFTASTNATGVATFDAVPPGSYTVSATGGTVPEGAVLATAASPVVVVPFQGGDFDTEFRYVFNPGSISGQLFRDNNGSNSFDAGDTPAPGMPVALYAGTDTTSAVLEGMTPVATTTTDANGVFTFNVVRPGQYVVKVSAIPTISIVGGSTQAVTVGANAATAFPVTFTGNLIGTIAEARAAETGSTVAFEGIATVSQSTFATSANSNQIYVQDPTGGILVFGLPSTLGIAAGDSVRVIGTKTVFSGEVEITISAAGQGVTKIGTAAIPAPRILTVDQVLSGAFQSQLVSVPNVTVTNVGNASSSTGAFTVSVRSGSAPGDTFQVRIANGATTGITRDMFTVGNNYDITGELSHFMNSTTNIPQLKPRSVADVKAAAPLNTIAQIRQKPVGDTVTVVGVVTAGVGIFSTNPTGNQFNVQDATGGILILDTPLATGPALGDSVRVRGVLRLSGGELLLRDPTITKLGTGTVPAPLFVSADYAAHSTSSDPLQGSLVHASNLTVKRLIGASTATAYSVVMNAPGGDTLIVRVGSAAVGIPQSFWQVGAAYDVTGTLAQFNGPQIKVRSPADVAPTTTPSTVMTIAQAKARPVGDTVVVEGVVTTGIPGLSGGAIYVQDGTAGVEVFQSGLTGVSTGDFVRVRGLIATNQGETEIARFSSSIPVEITKLGTGGLPAPRVVTGAELLSRAFEGSLVRINDVTVTAISTPSTSASSLGAYNVDVTAPDGSTIRVRMEAPKGNVVPPSTFTVGGHYDLTGIAAAFASVEQLKPLTAADVVAR